MKVVVSVGTRPEFIKMAPLILELKQCNIETLFVFTGQHRDLCVPMFELFNVFPDIDLAVMKEAQTLPYITSSVLSGIDTVLADIQPDVLLVHGDTSTTLASALAAFYRKIPVGHIEAGLRSGDRYSPFPEEMNRTLTSRLALFHYAPTHSNKENLINEGIAETAITVTGNTVIDAVTFIAENLSVQRQKKILVTAHRRENFGEPMEHIAAAVRELAERFPDRTIVFPMHPNPMVRKTVMPVLDKLHNVLLIEPLDYLGFVREMASSELILTDSGGVQEEGPAFKVPVVVMRRETERPEGVQAGTLILAGTEKSIIVSIATKILSDASYAATFAAATNPYGDGTASKRIVSDLSQRLAVNQII